MNFKKSCRKSTATGLALVILMVATPVMAEPDNTTLQNVQQNIELSENKQGMSEYIEVRPTEGLPQDVVANVEGIKAVPGIEEEAFGQTVTEVTVAGNKNIPVDSYVSLFRVRPGATLTSENIGQDLQMIYETGWYYDVQAQYAFVPEGVRVTYVVNENPVLTSLEVVGSTIYSDNLMKRLLGLENDQPINSRRLSEGMRAIEAAYNRDGYILARVSDIDMQPDGSLKLLINEGIVESFVVKGTKKTKDKVVLRELRLYEGEPFNVNDGRRSMQRVYNLGYFEDVNIKLNPGRTPNGVEVEVSVVETSTGTFGIGAGYSEADGLIGMIMLGDKNFRGTGEAVNIRWEFGGVDNKNYDISYHRPWLDRHASAFGLTFYDLTHEYEELDDDGNKKDYYERKRKGIEFYFTRPTNDFITNSITFKFRKDSYVRPVAGDTTLFYETYPQAMKDAFGTTHSIVLARALDTRDNIYNPSRGNYAQLSGEFAGLMGGDFDFNKFILEGRTYYPVGMNKVIAFRGVVGYATGTMPLGQRFSLGGDSYLRGYKDDRFYGYKMVAGTAEYRFPITKNFQGVVFSDVGYAWDKGENINFGDVEYGYGFGVRINSPLGPIRLDYAHGDKWRVHFSFGGQF